MRATITMPLETLKAIIERAREYEFVDDSDEDLDDDDGDDADEDDGADAELDEDGDDDTLLAANDDESDEIEEDDDLEEAEAPEEDDEALDEVLEKLTSEELSELLALAWVGEGDYDSSNWNEAMGAARALTTDDVIVQLAENPMLSDAIERGLAALGYQITED